MAKLKILGYESVNKHAHKHKVKMGIQRLGITVHTCLCVWKKQKNLIFVCNIGTQEKGLELK